MGFLHKSVREDDACFGCDLRDLRDLHAITFEQACFETKIDASILRAFEEDRIQDLDDPIFSKRHLLRYVSYLGGHSPYFEKRYDQRLVELNVKRTTKDLLPRMRNVRFWDLFVAPQFLALLGVILLAMILGGYVLWQAYMVNTPPILIVDAPIDGERIDRPRVVVKGRTMPEAFVTVNDRDVPVNQTGEFEIALDVKRGTSVIVVTARRRRGSDTTIVRRVLFDRPLLEIPNTLFPEPVVFPATSTSSTGQ